MKMLEIGVVAIVSYLKHVLRIRLELSSETASLNPAMGKVSFGRIFYWTSLDPDLLRAPV